jgi:hypothetical protein
VLIKGLDTVGKVISNFEIIPKDWVRAFLKTIVSCELMTGVQLSSFLRS